MFEGFWGRPYEKTYNAPALDFEKAAGITGIGRRYMMPRGQSLEAMEFEITRNVQWAQNISLEERLRRAQRYASSFRALNPELAKVNYDPDNLIHNWHYILGVTSGLNPDDIDYFINNGGRLNNPEQNYSDKLKVRLSTEFNSHAGIYWRPSAATAALIVEKLRARADKGPGPFSPNSR